MKREIFYSVLQTVYEFLYSVAYMLPSEVSQFLKNIQI